jgi:MFS family permease
VLVAARAAQGAGAAFVMPLALGLLTAAFEPGERPRALGIFAAAAGAAVALGPPLGGAVVQGISWPWIFWLNVPLTAAIILTARTRVDEQHGPKAAVDTRGAALIMAGSFLLVWGLVRANTLGWGSAEVLTALVAGLSVMATFVLVESRLPAPMLPISLFRSRSFAAGSAAIFFLWGSGLGGLFFMTQLLQNGLGNDPLTAGLRLMPWGAVTFTLPTLTGRGINRYGEARFIAGGAALHAAAFAWVALAARTIGRPRAGRQNLRRAQHDPPTRGRFRPGHTGRGVCGSRILRIQALVHRRSSARSCGLRRARAARGNRWHNASRAATSNHHAGRTSTELVVVPAPGLPHLQRSVTTRS